MSGKLWIAPLVLLIGAQTGCARDNTDMPPPPVDDSFSGIALTQVFETEQFSRPLAFIGTHSASA